jgi:hypothetical protein
MPIIVVIHEVWMISHFLPFTISRVHLEAKVQESKALLGQRYCFWDAVDSLIDHFTELVWVFSIKWVCPDEHPIKDDSKRPQVNSIIV